jgi:hypothetical protein
MGEYAIRADGLTVKIGTCENLCQLRYDDRAKLRGDYGLLNPADVMDCFWRLPHPDEDSVGIGEYKEWERGIRLFKRVPGKMHRWQPDDWDRVPFAPDDLEPGRLCLTHESGIHLLMPCYHGLKEYDGDYGEIKIGWNGRDPFQLELISVKNTKDGLKPVFRCRHCRKMWRCEWEEIIEYVWDEKLKSRLIEYAGETK